MMSNFNYFETNIKEKRNGFGILKTEKGEKYLGEIKDNKYHGKGILNLTTDYEYIGEFKNNAFNGKGSMTFKNGKKYIGQFIDNNFNGLGILTQPDGYSYEGEFKDNGYNGKGKFIYPTGEVYIGEFKNSLYDGNGILTFTNGTKYEGEFKDGKYCGIGIMTIPHVSKYEGEFKNNKYHGIGIIHTSTGEKYVGQFINNNFVGNNVPDVNSREDNIHKRKNNILYEIDKIKHEIENNNKIIQGFLTQKNIIFNYINNGTKYPFLQVPNGLDDVFSGKYLEEITKIPKSPNQPYLDAGYGLFANSIIYIGGSILFIILFAFLFSNNTEINSDIFKIIGGALLSILIGFLIGQNNNEIKAKDYNAKKLNYDQEYSAHKSTKQKIQDINFKIKEMKNSDKINFLLNYYYKNNTKAPDRNFNLYKMGKSEMIFLVYLKSILGDYISNNKTIMNENYYDELLETNYKLYQPDLVYHNPITGICIDIEIDEKYEKETQKIIHEKDDINERNRNCFFIRNGWIVVRFSDTQIINNSLGCITFLLKIIQKYDPEPINEIKNRIKDILFLDQELCEIDRW